MADGQGRAFSEFVDYVTAQLERIQLAMQSQSQVGLKVEALGAVIKKMEKRLDEVDGKIRLLEVYQSENFSNNERLFHSQPLYETIDQKINIIEQMQANIIATAQQKSLERDQESQDAMIGMERRVREIQSEIQKMKGKKGVLSKFRREISPTLVNCDSTKDISIDHSTNNDLKKVQAKLQDYVNQRLKAFEKKYSILLNESIHKTEEKHEETVKRQSRVNLKDSNIYQINSQPSERSDNFRKTIDHYYNETTEKQEMGKGKKDNRKSQQRNIIKSHKTPSKSKSKKKKSHSARKSTGLHSVNEYLKLAKKG